MKIKKIFDLKGKAVLSFALDDLPGIAAWIGCSIHGAEQIIEHRGKIVENCPVFGRAVDLPATIKEEKGDM
jgi:hypothetical protein